MTASKNGFNKWLGHLLYDVPSKDAVNPLELRLWKLPRNFFLRFVCNATSQDLAGKPLDLGESSVSEL